MSELISGRLSPAPTDQDWMEQSYSISYIRGCRVVFGLVPADDLPMLTHGYGRDAMLALDLAYRFGATYVIGTLQDLEALRRIQLPPRKEWQLEAATACNAGFNALGDWLWGGDRGRSAEAVAKRLFGIPLTAGDDHPHDGADLQRCLALLECTDHLDQQHIERLRDISPQWACLVAHWPTLVETFLAEVDSGRLSRTNQLIDTLLAGVSVAEPDKT